MDREENQQPPPRKIGGRKPCVYVATLDKMKRVGSTRHGVMEVKGADRTSGNPSQAPGPYRVTVAQ